MKQITVKTNKRNEMIDITKDIQKIIEDEKIQNGRIVVFNPHTTAGLTINEGADPDVQKDIINFLNDLIPKNNGFLHAEGNSDAHIKASLMGSSLNIIVENNKLVLGTWQHIFFFEGDGPRNRKVYVEIFKK